VTEEARIAAAAEELALAREELSAAEHLIAAKLPRVALGRAYRTSRSRWATASHRLSGVPF